MTNVLDSTLCQPEFLVIFCLNRLSTSIFISFFLNKVVIPQDLDFHLFFRVLVIVLVRCVTPKNSNFIKKGKIVISVKIRFFF